MPFVGRNAEIGLGTTKLVRIGRDRFSAGQSKCVFKLSENSISDYLESIEQFTYRAIGYDVRAGLSKSIAAMT